MKEYNVYLQAQSGEFTDFETRVTAESIDDAIVSAFRELCEMYGVQMALLYGTSIGISMDGNGCWYKPTCVTYSTGGDNLLKNMS